MDELASVDQSARENALERFRIIQPDAALAPSPANVILPELWWSGRNRHRRLTSPQPGQDVQIVPCVFSIGGSIPCLQVADLAIFRYRVDRFTLNCAAISCTGTSFERSSVRIVLSPLGLSFFGPLRHFHWLLHNDIERDHEAENDRKEVDR